MSAAVVNGSDTSHDDNDSLNQAVVYDWSPTWYDKFRNKIRASPYWQDDTVIRKEINIVNASTQTQINPYLSDPDVQLMLLVKQGDDEAFAELVETYQDRVVSIFANILDDPSAAEDLAQETFLRIYRARQGYEPQAKFSTWLFRIANNLASNTRRSKNRRKEVQFGTGETGPLSQHPPEKNLAEKSALMPARMLDKSELQQIIRQAMETLNDKQRMALLLNKFEEMSYADIGDTLELSPAAVKSLLARARENLREYLEKYMQI